MTNQKPSGGAHLSAALEQRQLGLPPLKLAVGAVSLLEHPAQPLRERVRRRQLRVAHLRAWRGARRREARRTLGVATVGARKTRSARRSLFWKARLEAVSEARSNQSEAISPRQSVRSSQ